MVSFPRAARALLVLLPLVSFGLRGAVAPNSNLTLDQQASRFLSQATFGPTPEAIAELRALNYAYEIWIDREIAKPATSAVALLEAARAAGQITTADASHNRRARNQVMLTAPDQLRQRVAYALSQILVISDVDSNIANGGDGSSSYYDLLARNALGNFRTLLLEVTRHPMMGRYLSHYKNRKANPTTGTRPDENYAREVMQLFTIGLYQLQPDGEIIRDGAGRPVESYTNEDITELARVFTGFTDESGNNTGTGTGRADFPSAPANYTAPMRMWESQHDVDAKRLLSYPGARKVNLPAGQPGLQDVADALDNLIEHPNTAPYLSRLLIQRLVTSNPTNGYVARVAARFVNNGAGVRGDLGAVIKAILLDPEARGLNFVTDPEHGRLREPFLRVTAMLRAFRFTLNSTDGLLLHDFQNAVTQNTIGHFPLSAPTVFNFYSPDYEPPGPIADARLFGPEFQILNSVFAISTPNVLYNLVQTGAGRFRLNIAEQESLAAQSGALLDNLDLLLTHGTMSAETRAAILAAVDGVRSNMVPGGSNLNQTRARLAIYLTAVSPDCAISK